ncbi:hypothetical protein KJ839_01440, partial [Patescibacteria group bacterium]|nr:hypothetical protein [Patescibacteria group bacterium]
MKKTLVISILTVCFIMPIGVFAKEVKRINLPTDYSQIFKLDDELYVYGNNERNPDKIYGLFKKNRKNWESVYEGNEYNFGELYQKDDEIFFIHPNFIYKYTKENGMEIDARNFDNPFSEKNINFNNFFIFKDKYFVLSRNFHTYTRNSESSWEKQKISGYLKKHRNKLRIKDIVTTDNKVYLLLDKNQKKFIILSSENGFDWKIENNEKEYLYFEEENTAPDLDMIKYKNWPTFFIDGVNNKKGNIYKVKDKKLIKKKYRGTKKVKKFKLLTTNNKNTKLYSLIMFYKDGKKKHILSKTKDLKNWTIMHRWSAGTNPLRDRQHGQIEPQLTKFKKKIYLNPYSDY